MANRKRPYVLRFSVTDEEKELIEQKMKMVDIQSKSKYLRKIAINGYIINIDMTEIKRQNDILQKLSNNVNQIARRVNSTNIYQEDVAELKELINKIWRIQRHMLSNLLRKKQ